MKPTIAILGAGPSGLALARFLERANIDYTIFERDDSETWAIGRGGTLDLHTTTGQAALKEAGLLAEFKSLARYDATNTIADGNGKIYVRFGENSDNEDESRPEIDRKDLRALLLNAVPAHKIQWDRRVQQVQKEANGLMSVRFVDGSVEDDFQLVVGADGAWSKARSLLTSAKPQYSGYTYLTTLISSSTPVFHSAVSLAGQGNYMAFGDSKSLALQKLGDGSYYVAVGLRVPERWSSDNAAVVKDPSALRQMLLRDYFADWPQVHTDLVKHSEGDFRLWPLYALPTESLSWTTVPGITLIGDAAHVTTPFVGEGVNCALYDSLQLAEQIVKHGMDNLDAAVSAYEQLMLPRGIDLIKRSEESGEMLFAEDSPRGWLKTLAGIEVA